jgi:hypothetical protein
MTTLREAAQQALEALEALDAPPSGVVDHYELDRRKQALRTALAQKEQEPVAWMTHTNDLLPLFHKNRKAALDWQAQPTPLYTHPPRREWKGLTEEDMEDLLPLYSDPNADAEMLEFARAVEAKLKEKNNG